LESSEEARLLKWFIKLRKKYPAPEYNRNIHGSWNPGDFIPSWLMRQTRERLKELCKKHALDHHGSTRRLIKRMYLHWRASKLQIGSVYFGYAPGYEFTRTPTCSCGVTNKKEFLKEEKRRLELKTSYKEQLRKFLSPIQRFPRC
jgi:hypothetical protein